MSHKNLTKKFEQFTKDVLTEISKKFKHLNCNPLVLTLTERFGIDEDNPDLTVTVHELHMTDGVLELEVEVDDVEMGCENATWTLAYLTPQTQLQILKIVEDRFNAKSSFSAIMLKK